MKKLSRKFCILLLTLLLLVCTLALTACQSKVDVTKDIYSYGFSESHISGNKRIWTLKYKISTDDFEFDQVTKIVVKINGEKITADLADNYFTVECTTSENAEKPTIDSCYAYVSPTAEDTQKDAMDMSVTIIVGVVLLIIGAVLHFIAVASDIPILTYIPGGVFVLCVIGAFAFSTAEGFIMLAFFAVYWIACRVITRFFLD